MKLRVFEAFAGYGSQSIALDLLSQSFPDFQFETVGISEIDKYAIRAYHTLHGEAIPNHGDITKIDWSQTADFDLLTYSFPCQDISSVGKQRGFSEGSGTRSSCLWACANAIEKKHPRFLLMENVKALTQKKFSADFRRWRKWLIKQGYTNYYAVLNAKDYGVPQNRERVFMVSFRREHTPFTFPKPFELVRRLKHILEDVVDEKYWLKQEQIQALIKHNERKQSEGCGFISSAKCSARRHENMVRRPRIAKKSRTFSNSRFSKLKTISQPNPSIFAPMIKLLEHTRRPDISFSRKRGTIRITAKVARILTLRPGDSINIAVSNGEYLLHAVHRVNNIGRHEAQCYPTKRGSNNYCAYSVRLCRALLDSVGVKAEQVAYMVGEAFVRGDTTYLPIITALPL